MGQMETKLKNTGIVPVLVLEDAKDAVSVAGALREGGIYCAEVTFRTAAAADAIQAMKQTYPDMLIGAGTILSIEQVDAALGAGAEFIVSPSFDQTVVRYCREKAVFMIPGVSSPSEVGRAYALGLQVVKFFPAEVAGGLDMIKSMAAPFDSMRFMPTGGINAENVLKYLDYSKVLACGGSWMVNKNLIKNRDFSEITRLSREAMDLILGFRLEHIGIRARDAQGAQEIADDFCELLDFNKTDQKESVFAGTAVEVMKGCGLGEHGHIALGTNHVERAKYYLQKKGVRFREDTARYENGEMVCLYFEKEIAGFAVHLVKK